MILGLLFTSVAITQTSAKNPSFKEFGIRVGTSTHAEPVDFKSYEAFGSHPLPWHWQPFDWKLRPHLNGSLGALRQEKDTTFLATIGPALALSSPGEKISFDMGGGLGLVGEETLGDHRFGGHFQLAAHGGVSYTFRWDVALGYRLYHLSDGGIFGGNGLNRHLLELSYRF